MPKKKLTTAQTADTVDILAEIRKMTKQVIAHVETKMLLSQKEFGQRIVHIEKALDDDIADLQLFKTRIEAGHMELVKSVEALSKQNATEHGGIMTSLEKISNTQAELLTATSGLRATKDAEEALSVWKRDSRLGKIIFSKKGMFIFGFIGGTIGIFALLAIVHVMGWQEVDPVRWLKMLFSKAVPGALP